MWDGYHVIIFFISIFLVYLLSFFYLCITIGTDRIARLFGMKFGMHTCGECGMVIT